MGADELVKNLKIPNEVLEDSIQYLEWLDFFSPQLSFCFHQPMNGLQEICWRSSWELELDLVSEPDPADCAEPLDQGLVPAQ